MSIVFIAQMNHFKAFTERTPTMHLVLYNIYQESGGNLAMRNF